MYSRILRQAKNTEDLFQPRISRIWKDVYINQQTNEQGYVSLL